MSWKKSLKPDWRKIVFSLFFIFAPIAITYGYDILGITTPSYFGDGRTIGVGYPLIFLYVTYFPSKTFYTTYGIFGLITFILDLFFWYLLSCLIVWIYDKVKKK